MSVGSINGASALAYTTPARVAARTDSDGDEARESAAARANEARTGTEAASSASSSGRGGNLDIRV